MSEKGYFLSLKSIPASLRQVDWDKSNTLEGLARTIDNYLSADPSDHGELTLTTTLDSSKVEKILQFLGAIRQEDHWQEIEENPEYWEPPKTEEGKTTKESMRFQTRMSPVSAKVIISPDKTGPNNYEVILFPTPPNASDFNLSNL